MTRLGVSEMDWMEHVIMSRRTALTKQIKEHDLAIFDKATSFAVLLIAGRRREREEFKTFASAVYYARDLNSSYGQRPGIYAETPEGRSAHLAEADWDELLARLP